MRSFAGSVEPSLALADGVEWWARMEPIRRPFADWVESRVVPFFEDRPWVGMVFLMGVQSILLFRWYALGVVAVAGAMQGLGWLVGWDRWRRWQRIERMRANHICLHCGYDMRATPERCSECGRWADEPVEE
jgi:hypothetical protein